LPAAELWRRTLSRIPTVFGRLAYLAALRGGSSGRYEHPVLSDAIGAADADRTLRHSHHQVFAHWLTLTLEEQKDDLDAFFRGGQGPRDPSRYRELAPPGVRDVERQLYITDLETLLELLKYERGGASPAPEA